jgi:hypothetical protein
MPVISRYRSDTWRKTSMSEFSIDVAARGAFDGGGSGFGAG